MRVLFAHNSDFDWRNISTDEDEGTTMGEYSFSIDENLHRAFSFVLLVNKLAKGGEITPSSTNTFTSQK